jgi:hypothetical protein
VFESDSHSGCQAPLETKTGLTGNYRVLVLESDKQAKRRLDDYWERWFMQV